MNMFAPFKPDRRRFLKTGTLAAGGLMLGTAWLPALAQPPGPPALLAPDAYIHIGTDDVVTLIIHKPEVGQGTETSVAMLLAEELECDWSKVRTEFAPINPVYGAMQGSVGSSGIRTTFEPMRRTGAAARMMLIQAAAEQWGVDPARCRAGNSTVIDTETNTTLSYGSLAEAAAKLAVPTDIILKAPGEYRLIGKPMLRRDAPAKVDGTAIYGIDMQLPGMVYAVVARTPVPGGTLVSFDATASKAVPGVREVFEIPQGIAIVADNTWAALSGRRVLETQWDAGENATLSSAGISQRLADLVAQPGVVATNEGDAAAAAADTVKTIEAIYEVPYLAHAPMEPQNSVALVTAETCEIWTGTQMPGVAHLTAMQASGLPPAQVKINTLYSGGGFGSRGGGPVVAESIAVAKKMLGTPVKLVWSREDDMLYDRYRPASVVHFKAGVDAAGKPVAWTGRVSCSSFAGLRDGIDREAVAGLAEVPYEFAHNHFEYQEPGIKVATNYWRSVGHSQNTFFTESFMDELAGQANKDPVEFRRELLANQPRMLGVLNLAAEKAAWTTPLPAGRFRGIAAVNCFGSYNAQVAEISIDKGEVRVHRVICAIDCGQVVNPAGVIQQAQSAIVYGLSAALRGSITFENGRVLQTNFHQYEPLRMREMPVVEVHMVASMATPTGIGEIATPAIAPAVTNAIFSATGTRIRKLPISLALTT